MMSTSSSSASARLSESESLYPALKIWDHGSDLGLLQHDLRYPGVIWARLERQGITLALRSYHANNLAAKELFKTENYLWALRI